jgi:3-hydroxyacyl-CoA dehydrogenase
MINRITCIGAGTIGSSWAAYFLMHDLDVTVMDTSENQLDIAKNKIAATLKQCASFGMIAEAEVAPLLKKVHYTIDMKHALEDADFIQESALETYDVKEGIIKAVDLYAPKNAIFATSSSGLLVSKMQSFSSHPERIIIGHPFNPPHLIPLVEIVKGGACDEVIAKATDFYTKIGKSPITINIEKPGHVANRIQAAVWRECLDLVVEGVCSVKDVDTAVCKGPGLRWALYGPHLIFHLGGGDGGINHFIDILSAPIESWLTDMAKWDKLPEGTREILVKGIEEEVGDKSISEIAAWRDEKLVAVMKSLELF